MFLNIGKKTEIKAQLDVYCLYTDIDYDGISYCSNRSGEPNLGAAYVDKISSITIPPGWTVRLYDCPNYQGGQGEWLTLNSDDPDLTDNGFNDRTASVEASPPGISIPPPGDIILHEGIGWGGDSLRLGADEPNLGGCNFSNKASSIGVSPGWIVILYDEINYGGDSVSIDLSMADLTDKGFNNKASSIQVLPKQGITLYDIKNYRGRELNLTSDDLDLIDNNFNDRALSIRVAPGWSATLYWNKDYGGNSITYTSDKANLGADAFALVTSSVKVLPPGACDDPDGNNTLTKGTCIDGTGSYTDSCQDEKHVMEWTCALGSCKSTAILCPPAHPNCSDGACVADSPPPEPLPPSTFPSGPAICTLDVVLVIDTSGSMGGAKIDAAKDAAKTFTNLLLPDGNLEAIVRYSNSASILVNWNNDPGPINTKIEELTASGCTNYIDALQKTVDALNEAPAGGLKTVIFMSDGKPECSGQTAPYDAEKNKANQVKGMATLYTIAFDAPSDGKTLLKAMASSPAHYYETSDPATLEAMYKEIFGSLLDQDGDGYMTMACPCDPEEAAALGFKCYDCDDTSNARDAAAARLGIPPAAVPPEEVVAEAWDCLIGGLVPCGRKIDNPFTDIDESASCTLCHIFVLFKKIVDEIVMPYVFLLAVLMVVVGGIMLQTAGGDPGRTAQGKKILKTAIIGLAIILVAWLIVDTVITFLTPASSPFQQWHTIECPVP